jgi:hypothetical protein
LFLRGVSRACLAVTLAYRDSGEKADQCNHYDQWALHGVIGTPTAASS